MQFLEKANEATRMLVGSSVSILGGCWAWLGNNQQAIGALAAVLGAVYATVYFVFWAKACIAKPKPQPPRDLAEGDYTDGRSTERY